MHGKVYLVGAGPGDPKLITLKGKECLGLADTIIYDYLANPALLSFAKESAEKIYVGKKGGSRNEPHQSYINRLIIEAAQSGKKVVRLKGGDPFIFGRGAEEAEALVLAGIPFEVVPGVTSAIGVPTYAGIPLTHREKASSITIITGHEDPEKEEHINWAKLATASDTLVCLMGMANLPVIVANLIAHGRDKQTPIALIQWGTYPHQKTLTGTLETIVSLSQSNGIRPPVVMVVGDVVSLRASMNWFESLPLFGKKILVTRAREQSHEFVDLLTAFGADVLTAPTIQIVPPDDFNPLDAAIQKVEQYNTIIFTSVNGVRFFKTRLYHLGFDIRILKGISICAIGPRTREEIMRLGIQCDFVASEFIAEGVLDALEHRGIAGKRFLIPRAMEARELLPVEIKKRGGIVDVVPAYRTLAPDNKEIEAVLQKGPIDMITFASASTVKNFAEGLDSNQLGVVGKSVIACMGPITAKAAERYGFTVSVMPKEYTFPALTDAIVQYYKESKDKPPQPRSRRSGLLNQGGE
ncbi:MAG: uroporphyrinogen-III C-methyltransferase [Nitrospirota bacterium]